jgi:short-subunit dehydrogenase
MSKSNGKYALITGATSGIGYELAKLFAKDGYNLVIVARNEENLQSTSNELSTAHGIQVVTISKDLSEVNAPFRSIR